MTRLSAADSHVTAQNTGARERPVACTGRQSRTVVAAGPPGVLVSPCVESVVGPLVLVPTPARRRAIRDVGHVAPRRHFGTAGLIRMTDLAPGWWTRRPEDAVRPPFGDGQE